MYGGGLCDAVNLIQVDNDDEQIWQAVVQQLAKGVRTCMLPPVTQRPMHGFAIACFSLAFVYSG